MHSRVVGNAEYESAVRSNVADGEYRVGHYVEPNVLHTAHCSTACDGCSDCSFGGYLFVRGPFNVNVLIFHNRLGYFGAGSSRIRGNNLYSRFIGTACNCRVAKH